MQQRILIMMILGIAVIGGIIGVAIFRGNAEIVETDVLKKFASPDEVKEYLRVHAEQATHDGSWGGSDLQRTNAPPAIPATGIAESDSKSSLAPSSQTATDFSTTNVQVEGVDEADFVKNDGKFIYVISGSKLVIVDAYPADSAKIVSETTLSGQPQEMYLLGDRLVVVWTGAGEYWVKPARSATPVSYWRATTHATVYSVLDHAKPAILRDVNVSGTYYDSRMIGDDVYLLTSESANWYMDDVLLPEVRESATTIAPDVYYFDIPERYYTFHTISSFNARESRGVQAESFLLGYANTLYVSKGNLYISYQKTSPAIPVEAERVDVVGGGTSGGIVPPRQYRYEDATIIHKFGISGGDITYLGMGEVAGHLLNQFSMDEWNGNLRVAATVQGYTQSASYQYSNVYVLGSDMKTIGTLQYIAPEEQIYAARFIGDRLYLVTFKRIDPFFVIDLSVPERPAILGKLKIPGFSDYLHPYDANHIIGIGKETEANQWGGVSTGGLKLALFDVTDVNNPKPVDSIEIGEAGTDSDALHEHKAFLFNREKNLLVIPVREVKRIVYTDSKYNPYGQRIWQGAYVYTVTAEDGFALRGTVSHDDDADPGYYWNAPGAVKRSLFMDSVLYTISSKKIVMSNLDNVTFINDVDLPYEGYSPPYPYPMRDI